MVRQILAAALLLFAADPFAAKRDSMVREQIEARGVDDADVLRVMRDTPRDRFVSASWRKRSYDDTPLPIGFGVTISQLAQLAGRVYMIEIVPALARSAAALLAELGYDNVTVRQGDGYLGWPERAPFDRIILTAAPEEVPQALIDQLACGGRLVAPVGRAMQKQDLVAIEKTAGCVIRARTVTTVRFVPMVHGRDGRGEKP